MTKLIQTRLVVAGVRSGNTHDDLEPLFSYPLTGDFILKT